MLVIVQRTEESIIIGIEGNEYLPIKLPLCNLGKLAVNTTPRKLTSKIFTNNNQSNNNEIFKIKKQKATNVLGCKIPK